MASTPKRTVSVVATFASAHPAALRRFVCCGPRGSRRMWVGRRGAARVATVSARLDVAAPSVQAAEDGARRLTLEQLAAAGSPKPTRVLAQAL